MSKLLSNGSVIYTPEVTKTVYFSNGDLALLLKDVAEQIQTIVSYNIVSISIFENGDECMRWMATIAYRDTR